MPGDPPRHSEADPTVAGNDPEFTRELIGRARRGDHEAVDTKRVDLEVFQRLRRGTVVETQAGSKVVLTFLPAIASNSEHFLLEFSGVHVLNAERVRFVNSLPYRR
jgi:hypothetical protein